MKNIEWAHERIRARMKHQYGEYLNEVTDSECLDTVAEGLVIDATVDAERKFRVTVYMNTRELEDDEPTQLCMDAYAVGGSDRKLERQTIDNFFVIHP